MLNSALKPAALCCAALFLSVALTAGAQTQPAPAAAADHDGLGFKDTPILPGMSWHVHDPDRPHPPVVTPATTPGGAPSDAVILFDGKNLSHWQNYTYSKLAVAPGEPAWKVADGYMEVVPKTGDIASKEKFGDVQVHVEWSSPNPATGKSQGRGNSGVLLMGRYEIQVLDAWDNPTYADGQASAMYGQWPPLANPARKPGEWNTYDIIFEAPRMDGDKVLKPAAVTILYNGVLVQNHKEFMGPTIYRKVAQYIPQPAEDSLVLQNHGNAVRYRNIWARRLPPESK